VRSGRHLDGRHCGGRGSDHHGGGRRCWCGGRPHAPVLAPAAAALPRRPPPTLSPLSRGGGGAAARVPPSAAAHDGVVLVKKGRRGARGVAPARGVWGWPRGGPRRRRCRGGWRWCRRGGVGGLRAARVRRRRRRRNRRAGGSRAYGGFYPGAARGPTDTGAPGRGGKGEGKRGVRQATLPAADWDPGWPSASLR